MNNSLKKSLLIGLGIFALLVVTVGVVYLVRKPSTVATLPTPTPMATPQETAVAAPIFAVEVAACQKSFVVACETSHKTCNTTTFACETVAGAGTDNCVNNADCLTPKHHACNTTTYACELVNGAGADTCTTDANCAKAPSAALKCMSKKMYEDDSRNRAGFYYVEKEITNTTTLANGQIIVYNVVTKNAGGNSAPDTTVTDKLSANLTYVDGDSGCTYDSSTRVVTCTVGTLSANSEAQRSFRAKVSDVSSVTAVANTAEVTSTNGQRDSCSVSIDAAGNVVVAASPVPTALPVAGVFEVTALPLGIGLLLLIMGGLGLLLI